ncbi:ATP/GTP-binding protein (plasmid) [Streptomyces sp. NBC_01766]|nr:ATP/GTP-binding protein [Streptomyces sp. NBC_01766]
MLVLSGAPAAYAGSGQAGNCVASRYFCVTAKDPGKPTDRHPAPAHASPGQGKARAKAAKPVCTVEPMDPQPPKDSGFANGTWSPGAKVYMRACGDGSTVFFWSATPPKAAAVDPAVVAQQAVDKMLLAGPKIELRPKPGKTGLVGLPVWMWTVVSPSTFGPNTATATAGAVSVTATAKVSKIVWAMGDGTSETCNGPGTPYRASFGKAPSPTCGHTYTRTSGSQPGKKYTVTATSTWSINWSVVGGGESGQLTETRQSRTTASIGELQVLG